jgi:hypothetical protein
MKFKYIYIGRHLREYSKTKFNGIPLGAEYVLN